MAVASAVIMQVAGGSAPRGTKTAFDPLLPGLMGNFGGDFYDGDKVHLIPDVSIVDLVQVPPNLRGDFVLQFRYDCVSTWFQPDDHSSSSASASEFTMACFLRSKRPKSGRPARTFGSFRRVPAAALLEGQGRLFVYTECVCVSSATARQPPPPTAPAPHASVQSAISDLLIIHSFPKIP